jgi:Domain of unknown function (DUF4202)
MSRFEKAVAGIDAANAADLLSVSEGGRSVPAEQLYGLRMSAMLQTLYPDASELLQLAARGQHVKRWTVPRSDYPMDRAGYHRWRNDLKQKHAAWTGEILLGCGYSNDEIARVGSLIRKERFKQDAEAQALEDTACHVFLVHYADGFAAKHNDAKMATILKKSWAKMSDHGRAAGLTASVTPNVKRLLLLALETPA